MSDAKAIHAVPTDPPVALSAESRIERFLEENFKKVVLALLLVVALLAGWFTSRHFTAQRNLEAAEKFSSSTSVEECDVVIQKYPGSTAAGNALLQKADLLWQQGKKQSSIDTLQEFLKTMSAHSLRASTTIALGTKQAAMGDKDAARATFETFLKNSPQDELAPAADIQLGDLLWQDGKDAEAKKHYDSLLQKYPGKMAMFTQSLDERLQLMGSALPQIEVAGPPPAPKPAPPVLEPPQITAPQLLPPDATPLPAPSPTATPPPAQTPDPAPVKPISKPKP
ncbi:MAG: tetratricopeptide repeat protein [Verrucomicrobia bacterium]|nr:tetratricopeptide repeat protein [Verrucomicrobiota bacterium]